MTLRTPLAACAALLLGLTALPASAQSTYEIVEATTYADAQTAATALGGHLVVIDDEDEDLAVQALIEENSVFLAWIGLNDIAEEGTFVWVTGAPVEYTNWIDGEPNAFYETEDCAVYSLDNLGWLDVRCGGEDGAVTFGVVEIPAFEPELPSAVFADDLGAPQQLLQLADGTILVANPDAAFTAGAGQVLQFNADGTPAGDGVFVDGLDAPIGLEQLPDGTVLVADYSAGLVLSYQADGTAIGTFAEVPFPNDVRYFADAGGITGVNVVSDDQNTSGSVGRFITFDLDGTQTFASNGEQVAPFAIEQAGSTFYVSELGRDQILVFNTDYSFSGVIEGFSVPSDITIATTAGGSPLLLVAESDRVTAVNLDTDERQAFTTGLDRATGIIQLTDGRYLVAETFAGRVIAIGEGSGEEVEAVTFVEDVDQPAGTTEVPGLGVAVVERGSGEVTLVQPDGTKITVASGVTDPIDVFYDIPFSQYLVVDFTEGVIQGYRDNQTTADRFVGFDGPTDIVLLPDSRLLVSEQTGNKVTQISTTGVVSDFVTGLDAPTTLTVTDSAVLVTESGLGRILSFTFGGSPTSLTGTRQAAGVFASGLTHPLGIAQLPDGRVLVSEAGTISSFSATGLALGTFATVTGGPSYLTVLSDGTVLASLPDQDEVVKLQSSALTPVAAEPAAPTAAQPLTLSTPAPNPTMGRVSVRLAVASPADVRAVVFDALGREVAVAFEGPVAEAAELTVDAAGFATGVYVLRVTGGDSVTARTFTVVR